MQPATIRLRSVLGLAALLCAAAAHAQGVPPPAPQGVLSLSASAQTEVTKDVLSVVMSATRDGQDAAGVQAALKQELDAALSEARKAAKPGQVEVQS